MGHEPQKCVLYRRIPDGQIEPQALAAAIAALPSHLRARLERQRHPLDRLRSLTGLQLLAEGMRTMGEVDFRLDAVSFGPRGKPGWPGQTAFSIAHAGGLVVCALDREAIGVDVERQRPLSPPPRFGLTAAEIHSVARHPERFFEFWCAREAVVKAAGDAGLAAMADVTLLEPARARLAGRDWHLHRLEPLPGYLLVVASASPTPPQLRESPLPQAAAAIMARS